MYRPGERSGSAAGRAADLPLQPVVERSALKFINHLPEFDNFERTFGPVVLPAHDQIAAGGLDQIISRQLRRVLPIRLTY